MALFQKAVIKKHLNNQDSGYIYNKWILFQNHFLNKDIQENIRNSKEEQYQEGFLRDLFVKILGYTLNPEINYNLITENKNIKDSKKADAAILLNNKEQKTVIAVIELKGTDTTDLGKIENQAFGYKNNQNNCRYVITSNFEKIRFYIDNAIEFIEFNLFTITEEQFQLLYLLLAYQNISKDIPKLLKEESVSNEETITKQLYKDYSDFKSAIYKNLIKNNTQFDNLTIYKKTQKLLDRFLFIFFAEDRALLPVNFIFRINKEWQQLRAMRIDVSLYDRYKIYFNDLNIGAKVSLPAFNETMSSYKEEFQIFAYNGGLFQEDEILDNINIDDEILFEHTQRLSNYDFESEVDVNILGHIFENSLNEIDEIKAEIEGQKVDKTKTKRKKDGVFYTPKYITKYIVENTIGKLCSEKKAEINLIEEEYNAEQKINKNQKATLIEKLDSYRNWLLELKICDPACGSGAFLNEALNYLIAEHRYLDELKHKLLGGGFVLSEIEMSILENNIFGVDINEESVEIAKLSLWLRTARPNRKLNNLSNNIKCGNSLIDDPEIAGDKAFNWEKEFPQVFSNKKEDIGSRPNASISNMNEDATGLDPLSSSLNAYHITWATHNSRVSERMIHYEYVITRRREMKGEPIIKPPRILSLKEEMFVTQSIKNVIEKYKYRVIGFNICEDHIHLVVVCNESEIPEIVKTIKSITSRELNIYNGNTIKNYEVEMYSKEATGLDPLSYKEENIIGSRPNASLGNNIADATGLDSLSSSSPLSYKTKGITQTHLWQTKYSSSIIKNENELYNVLHYVENNRLKHELEDSQELRELIKSFLITYYDAFKPATIEIDKGGFDVVIGNPPYVRGRELTENERRYLDKYNISSNDTAILFIKKGIELLNKKGVISFIVPKSLLFASNWDVIREYLSKKLLKLIDCSKVWDEVLLEQVIFIANTKTNTEYTTGKKINSNIVELDNISNSFIQSLGYLPAQETRKTLLLALKIKENSISLNQIYNNVAGVPNQKYITNTGKFNMIGGAEFDRILIKDVKGRIDFEWVKSENAFIKENSLIVQNIIAHIVNPKEHIKITACIPSSEHINKTTIANTVNQLIPIINEDYISNKYTWCILNSTLINWYVYHFVFSLAIRTMHFYNPISEKVPFKYIPLSRVEVKKMDALGLDPVSYKKKNENIGTSPNASQNNASLEATGLDPLSSSFVQEDFIAKADIMLDKNKELQETTQKLIRSIKREFNLEELSTKLNTWYKLTYAEFVKELEKKKVKLTLSQKAEWEDYFKTEQQKALEIKTIIDQTDREIDLMVYKLYDLTEEEIKIVEGA